MTWKSHICRIGLAAVFAGGLLFATGGPAFADRDDASACHSRLESARVRLDRDIAHHGDNSPQARRDRDRLEAARRWCTDHHADWDHNRYDNDHHDDDHHDQH